MCAYSGVALLFLPKYSPGVIKRKKKKESRCFLIVFVRVCVVELNPIELVWAKAKMRILRMGKNTRDRAIASLASAMLEVTEQDVWGYYGKCGYC